MANMRIEPLDVSQLGDILQGEKRANEELAQISLVPIGEKVRVILSFNGGLSAAYVQICELDSSLHPGEVIIQVGSSEQPQYVKLLSDYLCLRTVRRERL